MKSITDDHKFNMKFQTKHEVQNKVFKRYSRIYDNQQTSMFSSLDLHLRLSININICTGIPSFTNNISIAERIAVLRDNLDYKHPIHLKEYLDCEYNIHLAGYS